MKFEATWNEAADIKEMSPLQIKWNLPGSFPCIANSSNSFGNFKPSTILPPVVKMS